LRTSAEDGVVDRVEEAAVTLLETGMHVARASAPTLPKPRLTKQAAQKSSEAMALAPGSSGTRNGKLAVTSVSTRSSVPAPQLTIS